MIMHARQAKQGQRYGTPAQCGEYLGSSRTWFLEHVAPHLSVHVVGRRRLYSFGEIDDWFAAGPESGQPRKAGRPRRVV